MSTSYFILSKSPEDEVNNNSKNTITSFKNQIIHILPYNNINYYINNGLFESHLIEWCKQYLKEDKVFLDIGAHTGTYSLSLSRYCKKVYAFEPQKMTYYALCGSVALSNINNIDCLNYGLGSIEQVGKVDLNIISNDGGGSTIKETDSVLRKESIEIITLDSLNIKDICFIKMDIEGNELDALTGSVKTILNSGNPTILFESNRDNKELFDFITSIGYEIININGFYNMFLAVHK